MHTNNQKRITNMFQKMIKPTLAAAVLIALVLCWGFYPAKLPSEKNSSALESIKTEEWGWAKLVSKPVQVQGTGLRQLNFQMSDTITLTAFVEVAAMETLAWKVGDEVLVVSVPNKRGGNISDISVSMPTYFVINYRPQQHNTSR
jgi:hypothetical protein